jgi:hypothetical protein
MTTSRWIECICGLIACVFGFIMLSIQFFGPFVAYQTSSLNGSSVSGTTSYAQIAGGVAPILLLFGLPLLGVALGATLHAAWSSIVARMILWISTILLILLAALALLSIGPWLFPSVILALIASSLATRNPRHVAG